MWSRRVDGRAKERERERDDGENGRCISNGSHSREYKSCRAAARVEGRVYAGFCPGPVAPPFLPIKDLWMCGMTPVARTCISSRTQAGDLKGKGARSEFRRQLTSARNRRLDQ